MPLTPIDLPAGTYLVLCVQSNWAHSWILGECVRREQGGVTSESCQNCGVAPAFGRGGEQTHGGRDNLELSRYLNDVIPVDDGRLCLARGGRGRNSKGKLTVATLRPQGGKKPRIYPALFISPTPRRAPLVSLGPRGDMIWWWGCDGCQQQYTADIEAAMQYATAKERCRITSGSPCPRRSLALSTEHLTSLIGGRLTYISSVRQLRIYLPFSHFPAPNP
ncbi:hypothetical protein BDN71DRAFT_1453628 [Pleurotus eryngii]|uniref:Uncharacterized protein n=1 Tax=Pleurotus eryngii TaxID=5323 RepID=A0A9P5ZRC4_PLEER|nr:hypothetical protein BDN71DRAFT_1453628 [Pleurotus eryngii]